MTNREIISKFLERSGRYLKQGDADCFAPLVPYLILDVMYQTYCKYIKPIECKRELKMYKKGWMKAYHTYNADFFAAFNADETVYITDKMDSFEEFIAHDYMIAEMQIHNECMHLPVEQRKIVSAIILCGVLAQAAECVYEDTYTNGGRPAENPLIKDIMRNIGGFRKLYRVAGEDIDVNVSDNVEKSVKILCRHIVDWVYDGDEGYNVKQ